MLLRHIFFAIAVCVQTSFASGSELDGMICNHEPFISCLGATVKSCLEARQASEAICNERIPVPDMPDDEARLEYARAAGICSLNESARLLNLSRSEFDHCVRHLEPVFEAFHNRQMERREKWRQHK